MRLGITSKLFIAIFSASIVVVLAMGVAAQASFSRGFVGYLNDQAIQRLDDVLPNVAAAYRKNGFNWDFLKAGGGVWFRLIRPPPPEAADDTAEQAPGDGSRPAAISTPETSSTSAEGEPRGQDERGSRRDGQPRDAQQEVRPRLPDSDLTGVSLRIALLDAQRRPVAGNPQVGPKDFTRPISIDGEVVGYLSVVPFETVSTLAGKQFENGQLKALWAIGAASALLAGLIALLLARLFLAPVKRIARATHQLASGHYETRVKVDSEDELGRLAEDFNQLALALQKNEQMRRAFMADVSHELRTPIAVLRGELEALEDGIRPLSKDSIHSLQAETALLGKLVNDLYDLSLADAGALAYRKAEIDVLDTLQSTLDAFRERLSQHGLRLHTQFALREARVLADEQRLRQLFQNLLENSARYTDRGGEVQVLAEAEAGELRLTFQDSTPGVPDDVLPRLFERFYRVEASRNRASGGAGLGLAICKNIAEAHGGSLVATPSPLGGLRLVLTLPLLVK